MFDFKNIEVKNDIKILNNIFTINIIVNINHDYFDFLYSFLLTII